MTRECGAMDHECHCCLLHTCLVGKQDGMVVSQTRRTEMGARKDERLGNEEGSAVAVVVVVVVVDVVDVDASVDVVEEAAKRDCRARLETPGEDPLRLESAGCYCMGMGRVQEGISEDGQRLVTGITYCSRRGWGCEDEGSVDSRVEWMRRMGEEKTERVVKYDKRRTLVKIEMHGTEQ